MRGAMEREQVSSGQPETTAMPFEEGTIDLEVTHEVARQGNSILELSKELTSSSKALLEQIEPIT